ncbi:hypothetical protein [Brucella intermedia]|uniref:hypothetical protein n=1 Tax=Brucella intermedia TaxID=94625 RepID=UPI001FFF82C6|nr:hypothetical protein [Brucella intermedia]
MAFDGTGVTVPRLQGIPYFLLARVIVGNGESGKLLECHFVVAIEREQHRGNLRQRQTVIDDDFGRAETGGNIGDALGFIRYGLERLELVGGAWPPATRSQSG